MNSENRTVARLQDYLVSWSNGNLSRVETTHSNDKAYDEYKYSTIENKPCNFDMSQLASGEWSGAAFSVAGQFGLIGKQSKFLPSSLYSVYSNSDGYNREFTYTLDNEGYVVGAT